jgi:hypothetical protein
MRGSRLRVRNPWAIGPPNGLSRTGALDVHVDPLMVARQIGELVDHLLGDRNSGPHSPNSSDAAAFMASTSSNRNVGIRSSSP